ncbi:hypothetical protein [Umezakia ovalisporum]|uniref:Uncharacterized protein n=1 Tax=Umezakia ovalisporum FSS-62 TaxID=2971776 RepID=A0AA43GWP9_9CYAN|nr:hypothetical protein [Umezakia ovalisporum]MDH6063126.1 hypothetical protein [Umezakia ovalisporum FSS-62]
MLFITATVVVLIYRWGIGAGILVAILVLVGLIRSNKSVLANITYFIILEEKQSESL